MGSQPTNRPLFEQMVSICHRPRASSYGASRVRRAYKIQYFGLTAAIISSVLLAEPFVRLRIESHPSSSYWIVYGIFERAPRFEKCSSYAVRFGPMRTIADKRLRRFVYLFHFLYWSRMSKKYIHMLSYVYIINLKKNVSEKLGEENLSLGDSGYG